MPVLLLLSSFAAIPEVVPDLTLAGTDGRSWRLPEVVATHRVTVFEFFSAGCPVQRAHDPRLVRLASEWEGRGVAIFVVAPEPDGTRAGLAAEARTRGYPFPILLDPGGRLEKALGVAFCATAVVADGHGRVRYRGGIDPDGPRLKSRARPWLRDAVEAVLAGREPNPARTQSRGCYLRHW